MTRLLAFLLVALVASLSAMPSDASAAPVFCMKGRKLRLRDGACKRKETQVGLAEIADLGTIRSDLNAAKTDLATTRATLTGVQADVSTLVDRVDAIEGGLVRIAPLKLLNGQSQSIFQAGPLTLTARCTINDAGNDTAKVFIATTQDGATFDAFDETDVLDIATPETDREFVNVTSTPTGTPEIENQESTAAAPDGTFFTGELIVGVNVLNDPATCYFAGHLRVN
jgi:hypothetical protein